MVEVSELPEDYLTHYFDLAWYKWIFVLSIGGFLSLFLLLFQPFGVSNYDPKFSIDWRFVLTVGSVGLVVSATLAANEFLLRPLLLRTPSRRQLLLWLGWVYLLTATVSFLFYNFVGEWHDLRWSSYFGFIRDVGMVISFPIAGFVFYIRHQSLLTRFIRLSSLPRGTPSTELLHLSSDNEKDLLSIALGDLLYLESQDNYLAVVTMENGNKRSRLIRSSLKRIEALNQAQLLRCHRSFIVNLQRVRSCQGNLHGLKLFIDGQDDPLPVSRGYARTVLERLGAEAAG